MPKRTLALIVGLIVLTVVLLFAATRTGQQPSTPTPTPSAPAASPTPTPPAYTTLEMKPNPATVGPTGEGKIEVLINTNQNTATGVQLELSYDPKEITIVAVNPGTFFQNPLMIPQWNKVDPQTGRISHAQVLPPSQAGVKGRGVIANIIFARVSNSGLTQTQLQFMPKTAVTQSGVSPSVLKSSTGTTINLGPATQTQPQQTNQPAAPQPTQ